MARGEPWDLLVVGGGTAGLVGAHLAATLGARVALVESARTGGDCLWTGCVPSKSLLAAAGRVADLRRAEELGVRVEGVSVDFPAVMRHVRAAIAAIEPVDSPQALRAAGVEVLEGKARFVGPRAVNVAGRGHRFHRALLATGAAPAIPGIPGLAEVEPLTSDTVWELDGLPRSLVVVGGGNVGCELGQAFARLGSEVTLVEARDRLLPREDADASAVVTAALQADGVTVLTGSRVVKAVGDPSGPGEVLVDDGEASRAVPYDALLVALGRRPRTEGIGLDAAGIAVHRGGFVVTDQQLRTTNPRVWAAGDVTGYPHLTHLAAAHAGLAASNALLGLRRRVDVSAVPRVTFTDPEVASVGAPSWAPSGAPQPRTVTRHHNHVDRAVADGRTEGFSRLVLDPAGRRIAGATLVGPRAGESLAELTLAVRSRMRLSDLVMATHAYPTYSDGPWNAAIDEYRRRAVEGGLRRASRAVIRLRRGSPGQAQLQPASSAIVTRSAT